MAGGGVGTQPIFLSTTIAVDVHVLASTLQRAGISFQGAHAFAQGLPVASLGDRRALASMFSDAMAQLRAARQV